MRSDANTSALTAVVVLVLAALLSACSSTSDEQDGDAEPADDGATVVLAFVGDINFDAMDESSLADPAVLFGEVAGPLSNADVVMGNLETAIGSSGTPAPKEFTYLAPSSVLDTLDRANIDVVTMANNHAIDYGSEGLRQTLQARESSPVHIVGIGVDSDDALTPFITEIRGRRIAFLGATDVIDSSLEADWTAGEDKPGVASVKAEREETFLRKVSQVSDDVDTVVVYLHAGVEGHDCPSQRQKALFQQIISAGADIVVGSHSHRLQGYGLLGHAFAAYGLGNFVFNSPDPAARRGGILQVSVSGNRIADYSLAPLELVEGRPSFVYGIAGSETRQAVAPALACAGLEQLEQNPAGRN